MTTIIDLSYPIGGEFSKPPEGFDFQGVVYTPIHVHEKHGRTNASVSLNVHMYTHVDPPYHFIADGLTIDEVPLERLMGPGFIFNVRGKIPEKTAITVKHLLANNKLPSGGLAGRIVIINSDWGRRMYSTDSYYTDAPYLDEATAHWLVEQKVMAVGLDNPPDELAPPRPGDSPVHRTLLSNNICLIENLANLEKIPTSEPQIIAFPIKIYKGCGAPARVVAIVE